MSAIAAVDVIRAKRDGAALSEAQIEWIIDAYTTSNRYPYGEGADLQQLGPNSGLDHSLNYVRNSVKAVVDAYDGSITLYAVDPTDPVLMVWQSAFPDLFTSFDKMPAELKAHLRYPEELFRIQTAAYSKYRLDPAAFFDRKGAWSVALAAPEQRSTDVLDTTTADTTATDAGSTQFASDSKSARFEPYYTMFHGTAHVVLGSGMTIAGATLCLHFTRLPYFQSLGIPMSVGMVVAVFAALTLGPALITVCSRFGKVLEPKRAMRIRGWRRLGAFVVRWPGRIAPGTDAAFLDTISRMKAPRRRDGATFWRVYKDLGEPSRYVERFIVES